MLWEPTRFFELLLWLVMSRLCLYEVLVLDLFLTAVALVELRVVDACREANICWVD